MYRLSDIVFTAAGTSTFSGLRKLIYRLFSWQSASSGWKNAITGRLRHPLWRPVTRSFPQGHDCRGGMMRRWYSDRAMSPEVCRRRREALNDLAVKRGLARLRAERVELLQAVRSGVAAYRAAGAPAGLLAVECGDVSQGQTAILHQRPYPPFQYAVDLARARCGGIGVAVVLLRFARVVIEASDDGGARSLLSQAADCLGWYGGDAQELRAEATALAEQSETPISMDNIDELMRLALPVYRRHVQAQLLMRTAWVFRDRGYAELAAFAAQAARRGYEEAAAEWENYRAHLEIGRICIAMGIPRTAEDKWLAPISLTAAELYDEALMLRGEAHAAAGAYQSGEEYLAEAYKHCLEAGDQHGQLWCLRRLGSIYVAANHTAPAEAVLQLGRTLAEKLEDAEELGRIDLERGRLACGVADHEAAGQHLRTAWACFHRIGRQQLEADVLLELGILARRRGDFAKARRRLLLAARRYARLSTHYSPCRAALELGIIRLEEGETRTGLSRLFCRAVALRHLLTALRFLALNKETFKDRFALALALAQAVPGKLGSCFAVIAVVVESEWVLRTVSRGDLRAALARQRQPAMHTALKIAVRQKDGLLALRALEIARADMLAAVMQVECYDPGGGAEAFLEALASSDVDSRTAERVDAGSVSDWITGRVHSGPRSFMEEGQSHLERWAKGAPNVITIATKPPTLPKFDELIAALPEGAHALYLELASAFQEGRWCCYRIWVSVNGDRRIQVSAAELDGEVLAAIVAFARREVEAFDVTEEMLGRLGQAIIPLDLARILVAAAKPVPLVVVPSGLLWGVPFPVLRVQGRMLVEQALLNFVPSLKLFQALVKTAPADGRENPPQTGALACFGGSVETRTEKAALQQYFAPVETVAPAELAGRIREGGAEFCLAYVAAHGDAEPGLRHSLHLDTTKRLTALDLLDAALPPLVVFGACSSAAVSSEPGYEPLGLPTACLVSGARTIICALFPTGDAATSEILGDTFTKMGEGSSPMIALREAQINYLRRNRHAGQGWEITDWAGLVIMGCDPALIVRPAISAERSTAPEPDWSEPRKSLGRILIRRRKIRRMLRDFMGARKADLDLAIIRHLEKLLGL